VLDLEDAVPSAMKEGARVLVSEELARSPDRLTFIRINHPSVGHLASDLAVLARHPAQAVMVPKVAGPQDLEEIDARLAAHERDCGLDAHAISVVVVIETCLGLRNLFDTIACSPRIRGAALASAEQGDLMAELRGQWTPTGEAMAYSRGKLICDARAGGCGWLIDGAFMHLADDPALAEEASLARRMGFTSKIAIHPRQVQTINRAFSPTDLELEQARSLIAAYREAEARGLGAVNHGGMMIDYANVCWAEQILAMTGT
jgi:citrate lyase subunit beta/citryl-CoA lyase